MKTTETIIEHIISKPEFKSLRKHYCYRNFIKILTPRLQKGIEFIYTRDKILFIAISHPAHKFHIDSNIEHIKSLLKGFQKYESRCSWLEVTQIKTFITKAYTIKEEEKIQSDPKYSELSDATFSISVEDNDIAQMLEKIKQSIIKTKNLQSKGIF